ncbi:MAG TPA: HD domain-containing protein, partial [Desulfobacteraceae bacterium]|nr:HD domain-containing protein [Desulfobacteraceae bacterium]
ERRLFTILKSIGEAVIATDEKGYITFMNPLAESLTGWKNPENITKPLSEIYKAIRKNTEKEINIPLEKILQGEKYRFPREAILLSKRGDKIPIFQNATPIRNEDKSITGAVLSFSNISRLKKAEEELKNSLTRLKNVMEGTVEAMAYTIETRDPYTAGHQRRVAKLATAIAKMMDLNDDQVEGIHMAGTLHDIGKIHVPSEILNKPGKISEAEYNIIKTHSQVGFDILKSIDFPWPIAEIVLQHHERLDGSGYPQGIKQNEILLEAKILAVADTVEALATHRPYRPAFTTETALNEIKTFRGILYDKKIVGACIKIFERGFTLD